MEPLTTVIVLSVWVGLGSIFYTPPPCEEWLYVEYIDNADYWHKENVCTKQPVFW